MLSGFECDDDQTGWLAGAALWATGAATGCMLAIADTGLSLTHWQVLGLAVLVSIVSLGVRLPVLLSKCKVPTGLLHAIWIFAFFAQVNWAGFLAIRAPSGMIAAEALLICLGIEAWLLFATRARLPWFFSLFDGFDSPASSVAASLSTPANSATQSQMNHTSKHARDSATCDTAEQKCAHEEEVGDIRREFVDGIDENGERYLSGLVKVYFEPNQRTEAVVLSFCPALTAPASLELECDTEDATARVEHATETGARFLVRRDNVTESACVSVEWFAQASSEALQHRQLNLP